MFFGKKDDKKKDAKSAPVKATQAAAKKPSDAKKSTPAQSSAAKTPAVQASAVKETILPTQGKPQPLKPSEIKERIAQGWLRAFITFELAGKPREHIEQTLRAFIVNIKNDPRVVSISEEYADAMEHDDGMFSAFVELEALVKDFETLTWLAINFMPASIEVLEPEDLHIESGIVTGWYNDLLAKLHEVSNVLREERAVNAHLTEAMNALIKNIIFSAVRSGAKTQKEISAIAGIPPEQLDPFFTFLVEKKRLTEKNGKYSLV